MKYVNAETILPEELLKEIQKYVHGEMVYVPKPEGLHKRWGENSGVRIYLKRRNEMIRRQFSDGTTIGQLSERYYLSGDSIKKIVYSTKID